MKGPEKINDERYRFDHFDDGMLLPGKRPGRLPAMGWNSWNAFGNGNTEALTLAMAEKICELGLDKLGYKYVVLDDGCYKNERVDGFLSNEEDRFPSGFRALADRLHSMGLKFGMYNDIGTNLCAGAEVGTCGHEKEDAKTYLDWDIDFIKVDNCYYPWDNATFSDVKNTKYTYAPHIYAIEIEAGGIKTVLDAEEECLYGAGIDIRGGCAVNIGTFDGTGPERTPVGLQSGELRFGIETEDAADCRIRVKYKSGQEEGCGEWLQLAVGTKIYVDELMPPHLIPEWSEPVNIRLEAGVNAIRIMNHRRQENTLISYAKLSEAFHELDPDKEVVLSICEWGKTQPQNWGYKVGDSWRILNDITFQVGSDGDPGCGAWVSDYTTSVLSQYNKAVVMDDHAGPNKGWNDPDMLMIGMKGLDLQMQKTHFTMWCMLNAPLMLGLDLRRVSEGDELFNIIANKELIALNQDALGIQAKRVYCSLSDEPDKDYVRESERVDILAKPIAGGDLAVSFINTGASDIHKRQKISLKQICAMLKRKADFSRMEKAVKLKATDLWSGEEKLFDAKEIYTDELPAHGNVTYRLSAV